MECFKNEGSTNNAFFCITNCWCVIYFHVIFISVSTLGENIRWFYRCYFIIQPKVQKRFCHFVGNSNEIANLVEAFITLFLLTIVIIVWIAISVGCWPIITGWICIRCSTLILHWYHWITTSWHFTALINFQQGQQVYKIQFGIQNKFWTAKK